MLEYVDGGELFDKIVSIVFKASTLSGPPLIQDNNFCRMASSLIIYAYVHIMLLLSLS